MIKVIFFDFDGVILDSMLVRDYGFRKIFENYPIELIDKFIGYHRYNGGLSRFHKIKYFYNTFLKEEIAEDKIQDYAYKFSKIMKSELVNKKYLIKETIDFIKNNYRLYNFHIVSGSEENELKYLCNQLEISNYFKSINGSPIDKNNLIKNVLKEKKYNPLNCILIGDSINDYDAARINKIKFFGYNNINLKSKINYIDNFRDFNPMEHA